MKTIVIVVVLAMAGCVTGNVSPIGRDTYILSATRCGACQPVQGYVSEVAARFCATQSKQMMIRSLTGNNLQPWVPGNATITFSCLSDTDPAYRAPTITKVDGEINVENH